MEMPCPTSVAACRAEVSISAWPSRSSVGLPGFEHGVPCSTAERGYRFLLGSIIVETDRGDPIFGQDQNGIDDRRCQIGLGQFMDRVRRIPRPAAVDDQVARSLGLDLTQPDCETKIVIQRSR